MDAKLEQGPKFAVEDFGDQLLAPGEARYEKQVQPWFSASSRLRPAYIIQPRNAKDVSKIILILGTKSTGDFAIRSGGHSHWMGGSNIDGGVTIDLSLLKGISYDAAIGLASIEPGNRRTEVFEALEEHGVAAPGGRDGNVSVAGFLTGGGNSYYTGRVGFGCDAIAGVEIVLADGTIINAAKNSHPDLIKALKGGWCNFGIVTRFDLETFTAGQIWGGISVSERSQGDAVAHTVVNFTENNRKNPEAAYLAIWTFSSSMSSNVLVAQVMVDTNGTGVALH